MTTSSRAIVVDASTALWAILPITAPVAATAHFRAWRRTGIELLAPSLWLPECASAIRRLVFQKLITPAEGRTALDDLFALELTLMAPSESLTRAAYDWAERLAQSRAYDGFYLAVAQAEAATLVTADQRLANGVAQLGEDFVRWIGDLPQPE